MEIETHPEIHKLLQTFDERTKGKFAQVVDTLIACGSHITMPYSKKIASDLFELRISGSVEVRVFYTFYCDKAYLLYAFVKKSQKIPLKEMRIALRRKSELYEL